MAIVRDLAVALFSNEEPCLDYEYPSDEGRFATTAIRHVISATDAILGIELKLSSSFKSSSFDALLFDIHLDGRLVHSGLLEEGNEKAVMKDIAREKNGRWKTRSFVFADVGAQYSRTRLHLPPRPAAPAYSPPTLEPHSSTADDPSSAAPEPRPSSPWDDPTYANRKETRYLAPNLGTIQIQAYRVKTLKKEAAPRKKATNADATTNRSAAEYKTRSSASQITPPPLELHEDDGRQASKSNTHDHFRSRTQR